MSGTADMTTSKMWFNWYLGWKIISEFQDDPRVVNPKRGCRNLMLEFLRRGENIAGTRGDNPEEDLLVRHEILMDIIVTEDTEHLEEATKHCRAIVEDLLDRGVRIPPQVVKLRTIINKPFAPQMDAQVE